MAVLCKALIKRLALNYPTSIFIYMETVGIFEAKTKLSQICKHVAQTKEPILITIRGVPLVKIDPIVNRVNNKSDIWEIRRDFIQKNGRFEQDFDLPVRFKESFFADNTPS